MRWGGMDVKMQEAVPTTQGYLSLCMRRALDSENLVDLPPAAVGASRLDDGNAFVGRGRL